MNKVINRGLQVSSLLALCLFAVQPMSIGANPKNIPYVVPAYCGGHGDPMVTIINSNGHHALQVNADNQGSGGQSFAGWEIFSSHPGVIPGFIFPNPTTRATPGTYTFSVSGLPANGNTLLVASIDALGNTTSTTLPIVNGTVSVTAPAVADAGSPLAAIYFWIFTSKNKPLPVYTVSNFAVNHTAVGIDVSHRDDDTKTGGPNIKYTWCLQF